jgi:hypothetical protein
VIGEGMRGERKGEGIGEGFVNVLNCAYAK